MKLRAMAWSSLFMASISLHGQVFETDQAPPKSSNKTHLTLKMQKREDLNTRVDADRFDLNLDKGKGVFKGNVNITHPDYTITAEVADIEFEPNRPDVIKRFIARGKVHWKTQEREGSCVMLDYDLIKRRITFRGQVVAHEAQRTIYGDYLIWDQMSNRLESIGRSRVELKNVQTKTR
jgi:lipopolysaccharide transport protein LptA